MMDITAIYEGFGDRNCENCYFFNATDTTEECDVEVISDYTNINTTSISCSHFTQSDAIQIANTTDRLRIKRG